MFWALFLLWLLLSGDVSAATCLWGLAASAVITWACGRSLGIRRRIVPEKPAAILTAVCCTARQIPMLLRGGLAVMRRIYAGPRGGNSGLVWLEAELQTDRGQAQLADAMTRTADAVTVRAEDGRLLVHMLDLSERPKYGALWRQLKKMEDPSWKN